MLYYKRSQFEGRGAKTMSVERKIKRSASENTEKKQTPKGALLTKRNVIWLVFICISLIILIILVVYNTPVKLLSDIKPSDVEVISIEDVANKRTFEVKDSGHIENIIKSISSFSYKRDGFRSSDTKPVYKLTLKNKKGTELANIELVSPEEAYYGMFSYKTEISKEQLPIAYILGLSMRSDIYKDLDIDALTDDSAKESLDSIFN